jgi:hypothetical protein
MNALQRFQSGKFYNEFLPYLIFYLQAGFYLGLIFSNVFFLTTNNLIFARISTQNSGHYVVWFSIFLSAFYIRIKTPFRKNPMTNAVRSFIAVLLSIAIIEGIFQIFLAFYKNGLFMPFLIPSIEIAVAIVLSILFKAHKLFETKRLVFAILMILIYTSVWYFAFGFRMTIDATLNPSFTKYYQDIGANVLEIFQWIFGCSLFAFAYRGREE